MILGKAVLKKCFTWSIVVLGLTSCSWSIKNYPVEKTGQEITTNEKILVAEPELNDVSQASVEILLNNTELDALSKQEKLTRIVSALLSQKEYPSVIGAVNDGRIRGLVNADLLAFRAQAHLELEDTVSAYRDFKLSYQNDSTHSEVIIGIAKCALVSQNVDTINYWTEKAVMMLKDDAASVETLAQLFMNQGKHFKAYEIYRGQLMEDNLAAGERVLTYWKGQERYDSMYYYADYLIRQDSLSVNGLLAKAYVFDKRGYYQSARNLYQKVLEIDSNHAVALEEIPKVDRKIAYLRQLRQRKESVPVIDLSIPKKKSFE